MSLGFLGKHNSGNIGKNISLPREPCNPRKNEMLIDIWESMKLKSLAYSDSNLRPVSAVTVREGSIVVLLQ